MSETNAKAATSVERKELSLEEQKLEIERLKLDVERRKAVWGIAAVAVPVLAVSATVMLGVWSQHQRARDDFTLKTAEILLASRGPDEVRNKARALAALFPSRLPRDFAQSFEPDSYGNAPVSESEARQQLLNLMANHPAEAEKMLAIHKAIFPHDLWLVDVEDRLSRDPLFHGEPSALSR
jgi:hypothetical protein